MVTWVNRRRRSPDRLHILGLLILISLIPAGWGCVAKEPFGIDYDSSGDGDADGDADGDGDGDADGDTDGDTDSDTDSDGDPCSDIMAGNYDAWRQADDSYAPGEVISIVGPGHSGFLQARCVDCHGAGMVEEPAIHDPRMQCWSWSCARGFPGGSCHGHGPNTDFMFNHSGAVEFTNCTKAGCHDLYDCNDNERENHGFMNAPDAVCNACHDYTWNGWPEGS